MMETWHLSEEAIMSMPSSRRYRMTLRKIDLEKQRQIAAKRK